MIQNGLTFMLVLGVRSRSACISLAYLPVPVLSSTRYLLETSRDYSKLRVFGCMPSPAQDRLRATGISPSVFSEVEVAEEKL